MAAATTSRLARPAAQAGPRLHRDPVWLRRTLIGLALAFLALFLLLPLAAVFAEALRRGLGAYFAAFHDADALAAIRLTFLASAIAVPANLLFGVAAAWAIAKFEFPGKSVLLTLIDLPFALPTAVAGIALASLYASNGWVGRLLAPLGIKVAYTELGVLVALTFIGLPFVVRTLQPVLEELEPELEEAADTLGATRGQTLRRVVFPELLPALITGFALSFARALGEYGSVVFISGNMPMRTEITPLLIIAKLEQFDYRGATALAVVMLVASFLLLLLINTLQRWSNWRHRAAA